MCIPIGARPLVARGVASPSSATLDACLNGELIPPIKPLPFAVDPLAGDERTKRGDEGAAVPVGAGLRGLPCAGTRGVDAVDARCERRLAGEDMIGEGRCGRLNDVLEVGEIL